MSEHIPNEIDNIIGLNLLRIRAAKGLTQKELGALCHDGLSSQQISKYELGGDQVSAERLIDLSRVLECNVTDFFHGIIQKLPEIEAKRGHETGILNSYRSLPHDVQNSLRLLMQAMAKSLFHAEKVGG